jgi:hypothetical protein
MLEVKSVYDKELAECEASFAKVDWKLDSMARAPRICPQCDSRLVHCNDANTTINDYADSKCRQCGADIAAHEVMETALKKFFEDDNYEAAKEGAEGMLGRCPECSYETYVMSGEENGCAWCQLELGECLRCEEALTPNNVAWGTNEMCKMTAICEARPVQAVPQRTASQETEGRCQEIPSQKPDLHDCPADRAIRR